MKRFGNILLLMVLILACLWLPALAEDAPDLTAQCTYISKNAKYSSKLLYDHSYHYAWESAKKRNVYLEVRLPEGQTCSGVQIKWYKVNKDWVIELEQDGEWVPYAGYEADYLTTYTELPHVTAFRISAHQRVADKIMIHELTVLGEGDRPASIQVWEPTWEKADLMLVVAHPDDEYVFMGGLIPYYGKEMGKRVIVAYITESTAERRTELLDGLWTSGQTHYPLLGKFYDRYCTSLSTAYKRLGEKKTKKYMIELIRHYQPDVLVVHDINGEYGHGVHKVCADIVINALDKTADPTVEPESAKQYGLWDVPKCYIHLYPQNQITMDWHQPMASMDGKTPFEVAQEAFACHLSQQHTEYEVYDSGPYDSKLFGLYRSLVGEDVLKNDMFENINEVRQ